VSRVQAGVIFRDPVHFLAFGFGSGLAPVAPGTFGTLVGVIIGLALQPLGLIANALVVLAISLAGIWICGESARRLGEHDHPGIVWDEIAGYLLTMLAAPPGWPWVIAGFCLFRFFDIWKPRPIRDLDHGMSGGLGIMLDDIMAGVYAGAVLLGIRYLIPA
jgi:phosphatidylglycerophosphatase A